MKKIIGHLDMDAFFAAVEERERPWLKGLPVVVGADPKGGRGRGVVSTANYKAREYGVHSAMPISKAWVLCEQARKQGKPACVFLGGNFRKYEEVSSRLMAILRTHVPLVEEASIDEAYFDLSFASSFSRAKKICEEIKKEVREKEGLTCSIGIGPNKLIAKIASDFQKPDGFTVVEESEAEKFLEPLPIRKIPGIGPKTEALFFRRGMKTVKDLKKFSQDELRAILGKWGLDLYEKIRGRDDSPLILEYEPKSIGEEETFGEDTRDPNLLTQTLGDLIERIFRRFQASDFKSFRTIVLKIRFHDFETKTRSRTFSEPFGALASLRREALKLLLPFFDRRENPRKKRFRLLGVRIEKLK